MVANSKEVLGLEGEGLKEILADPVQFWRKVGEVQLNNSFAFRNLANYALACHSLPCLDAFVKCIFSTIAFVKNDPRNCIKLDMFDAIMLIKSFLKSETFKDVFYRSFWYLKCIT